MTTGLALIVLLIVLIIFFVVLFYLFLKKDQELLGLKAKYENLQKIESDQFQINKQRDDYVAMMVHELRSPLSVIKGSADLVLREEGSLTPDQKYTLLAQVKESTSDLLEVVNDILDVSKIESGRFEIKKELGDINKVLQDEADYYMALAREKDIIVTTNLDTSFGDIFFDEDRIKHVMNNLLSNALKFTQNGGTVDILSKKKNTDNIEIIVADTGIGVEDKMKGKLFNKFVQMENRHNSSQKGTGLGLVIAKGIVEAHGGTIWVEDNDPQGARFIFTIPTTSDA